MKSLLIILATLALSTPAIGDELGAKWLGSTDQKTLVAKSLWSSPGLLKGCEP
jgi:hypothetical protein